MKSKVAALSLVAVITAAAWTMRESSFGLGLQHSMQSWLRPLAMVTTLTIDGVGEVPFFLNPDDKIITPWMWTGRVWELTETKWFVKSVRPGDVVVDVGANIGYYTVLAGLLVGDTGRVYAFEPDPVAFGILRRNVELSGLENIVLEQKAVSSEPGTIRLYLAEENKGDHRIYQPEGQSRESVEVEAVTLDGYFDGVEKSVDFVKVDTQGAELAILKGMVGLVRRSASIVMAFEYSPHHLAGFGSTGKELLDVFAELDVKMFELGPGGPYWVRTVRAGSLLRRFSPARVFFTNLLLVKQRPDLLRELLAERP